MHTYKILKKYFCIKAIAVCVILPTRSNSSLIYYNKNDIEKIAMENKYSDIEACAQKGSAACSTILGTAYYRGLSFKDQKVVIDRALARSYFQSSLIDSLTSRSALSMIIKEEKGLESKALMTSAATEGYYPAIYELAHPDYCKANKDLLESIKWRKIQMDIDPSTGGDEKGFIGSIYLQMSPPDYPNALYWLNKAITEEDDMLAQHDIARLYAEGKGVTQDYITAYMYYDLAGTAGAEEKSKLAERMTSEQVLEGMTRSHQWQDQHHSYRPGYGAWNDMGGIDWNIH